MVDSVTPISRVQTTVGSFETAAIQIAQARAQAASAHINEVNYLNEIAKTNNETNAHALDSTTAPTPKESFFNNALLNLNQSPNLNINTSALSPFSQFGTDFTVAATTDSIKAQQLHDLGVLQKDEALLEAAANVDNHIPLSSGASTVDLSFAAQEVISGSAIYPTNAQLTQIGNIVQPVANEPLTPALLQKIQTQLTAAQNPIQLSMDTLLLAMNLIAAQQPSPNHVIENIPPQDDKEITIAPVAMIEKVLVEYS